MCTVKSVMAKHTRTSVDYAKTGTPKVCVIVYYWVTCIHILSRLLFLKIFTKQNACYVNCKI